MEKPYAKVGEDGVHYSGPSAATEKTTALKVGVFGPHADDVVRSSDITRLLGALNAVGKNVCLVPIPSEAAWGKASVDLVNAVYQDHVLALIALDRAASHLAEQVAVKAFVPVVAISADRSLTSTNIPWIFRLPPDAPLEQAVKCLVAAMAQTGPNRSEIREVLASGKRLAGVRFESTGEIKE
jgi:hypothetical protein